MREPPSGPRFITVDLDVWSRQDLAVLAAAMEPKGFVQFVGKMRRKFFVSVEAVAARRVAGTDDLGVAQGGRVPFAKGASTLEECGVARFQRRIRRWELSDAHA